MHIKDRISEVSENFSKNQVLNSLGLQEKRDPIELLLPALGIFGAGLAVGALLGVLFAPKPGPELRSDIRRRIDHLRHEDENPYTG